jgi:hypothetical protein
MPYFSNTINGQYMRQRRGSDQIFPFDANTSFCGFHDKTTQVWKLVKHDFFRIAKILGSAVAIYRYALQPAGYRDDAGCKASL